MNIHRSQRARCPPKKVVVPVPLQDCLVGVTGHFSSEPDFSISLEQRLIRQQLFSTAPNTNIYVP